MTDVTITVTRGENGPRLVFTRPVEFVEVPYDNLAFFISELVSELRAHGGGRKPVVPDPMPDWAKEPVKEFMEKAQAKEMMELDEVNKWATTPELRDLEHYLKSLGFIQLPGRLGAVSQFNESYMIWRNGEISYEGGEVSRWNTSMLEELHDYFRVKRELYNGIVWRSCPSFKMLDGVGRILRMRFHFIHVTNTWEVS